jgi:hypothetical protein
LIKKYSLKNFQIKNSIEVDKNGEYSQWYLKTVKKIHTEDENKYILDSSDKELKSDEEIIDLGARDLLWNIIHDILHEQEQTKEGIKILSGEGDISDSQYLKGKIHMLEKFPDLIYNGYKGKYETFD